MYKSCEFGIKYYGMYRATVLKHLSHGKLKLFVHGITCDEDLTGDTYNYASIPDAEPASSIFGGAGDGNGEYSYPHLGSTVWCWFENGDYMKPIYFASTYCGEVYQRGFDEMLQSSETRHIIKVGNVKLQIDENNDPNAVTVSVMSGSEPSTEVRIDGSGTVYITTSSETNITSPVVNINGDVNINGTLDVTKETITAGIPFTTHKHPDATPAAITGTPVP